MAEAEASVAGGELESAAASLERAIRIQPRDARLWHQLAEVRLKQQQPGLAGELAAKSNVLAKGDANLVRSNWSLIAECRRLRGDSTGATEAEQQGM